jgi:hopanoid biosynthesis associated protein HpnK
VRHLVITADDFGVAVEVNEAVERAHRNGVLTAASLMVTGRAAADAIVRAHRVPTLRVGLHLTLVDGRPMLPASKIRHLVDESGAFRGSMAALGAVIACSRRARLEAAAEITAQFEAFRATGLRLDHCNTHKHYLMHPVVAGLITQIGSRFGLHAVRVPVERVDILRKIEPCRGTWLPAPLARVLQRRLRRTGLLVPDQVFGLRWTGQMTSERLLGLILHLPVGLSEIYLHPATAAYVGSAAGYYYRQELEALTARAIIEACRNSSLRLGGFSDFAEPLRALAGGARGSPLGGSPLGGSPPPRRLPASQEHQAP